MNTLHFTKSRTIIMLVFAMLTTFSAVACSIAFFTDRANRTTTVQTSSFDDEGYSIKRTAQEGYFSAGETMEVNLIESNEKSKDITSEITMKATWDSPVPDIDPWPNATITLDGEDVFCTVIKDNTISFTLPKHELAAESVNVERCLKIELPSNLAATGEIRLSFENIELSRKGWNAEYDNSNLSELDCGFGIVWNISQKQTTSLGNLNRDVIALLAEGDKDSEYGLQIIKNPYSNDDNTNNGAMMDWTSHDNTPWASYTITDLIIGEDVTTIGDNAFAGISGIKSVTLPNTLTHIGTSAFDGSGLEGELSIPASVTTIESLAFGNLPKVNTITFKHGSDDLLTLPDNESEGTETSGAFYVSNFLKTTFDFNGNSAAEGYNWTADNRMKIGISDIALSYSEIQKGETADPFLIINPTDHDAYESIKYEIISGGEYIEIDDETGTVTGTGVGSATIRVTIVDANGDTIQTAADVSVKAIPITAASLSYKNVAVGDSVDPELTYEPANATVTSRTYEIAAGGNYATVNSSTGIVTGKTNGVALVKVTLTDESGKETVASSVVTVGTPTEGTRYVWEAAGLLNVYGEVRTEVDSITVSGSTFVSTAAQYEFDETTGKFAFTGNSMGSEKMQEDFGDVSVLRYMTIQSNTSSLSYIYDKGNASWWVVDGYDLTADYGPFTKISKEIVSYEKGDTIGNKSSASANAYPSNGKSGSYWYTYQGADNIDADSVTYSATNITAGDSVTVKVAPSTQNVYGGTISYLYEYSTDGGSTWTAAKTTTDTSCTITVPENASSFVARVRANDDWGFTSSVYVYGSNVTVTPPLVGIDSINLSYSNVDKGSTVKPTLTINPSDYDAYQSIKYQVTSGSNYVTINTDTGAVTGTTKGTATIKVTIVDANGTTKTATANVTVLVGIDSAALSYGTIAVSGTGSPTLTINPSDYSSPKSITYSVHSGSSYASINASTGKVTGKANGTATIKVTIKDATGATVTAYCVVTVGTPTATRYVWSKYNTENTYKYVPYESGTAESIPTYGWTTSVGSTEFWYEQVSYLFEVPPIYNGGFTLNDNWVPIYDAYGDPIVWYGNAKSGDSEDGGADITEYLTDEYYGFSGTLYILSNKDRVNDYCYKIDLSNWEEKYDIITISIDFSASTATVRGGIASTGSFGFVTYTYEDLPATVISLKEEVDSTIQGSTSYGYVTSTSSSAYPTDGASDSYWYVKNGSDSIDPTAVSYSTTSPTAGSSVTARVTARSNTYGGTIKYLYQYSTDGGLNWTSSGSATTATSKSITVPSGSASFMVRVSASDNYGFTSANYVYGTNLAVTAN